MLVPVPPDTSLLKNIEEPYCSFGVESGSFVFNFSTGIYRMFVLEIDNNFVFKLEVLFVKASNTGV